MCVNFTPPTAQQIRQHFGYEVDDDLWKPDCWQDYTAPIITRDGLQLASYGFVPKRHLPPGVRFTTMNARAETIGEKPTYKAAWRKGQLCLVPMQAFFEPCYETGKAVRTRIGMADGQPFAVAGMWREWQEPEGATSYAFTQITINADEHPLMKRMHKPGDEKRSLVIVPSGQYQEWLACSDPELARAFLVEYPPDLMMATADPIKKSVSGKEV
ncbi:SOS response-associated peptidase family protein [Chromobacterium phragmitis]|uniref:SOS response-associated peptidase n=1 Tax=Chromobacterium amazonense TaxID=1382803 RepID=UPI0021B7E92E|nr:SOS response-associated peptidase [Chromobacterium amazonense]MBM2883891.1 SOS response-associated peptidase family protein [Chromobacterium amazonense]MDE1711808.1 SOS response-associated peptidase [Chromobacterium amazonense]